MIRVSQPTTRPMTIIIGTVSSSSNVSVGDVAMPNMPIKSPKHAGAKSTDIQYPRHHAALMSMAPGRSNSLIAIKAINTDGPMTKTIRCCSAMTENSGMAVGQNGMSGPDRKPVSNSAGFSGPQMANNNSHRTAADLNRANPVLAANVGP